MGKGTEKAEEPSASGVQFAERLINHQRQLWRYLKVKKRKELLLQVRKIAGSLIDKEKILLATRQNGIKLVRLLKVTDMKGAKGCVLKRHLERKI